MDPTQVRLSEHFLLSDFLGNHSVYTRGFKNMMDPYDTDLPLKMRNARALCDHLLEPLLEQAGPFSISYGYICPDVSRKIVTYQDPNKPSHHRWDLGAAADICVHEWTNHDEEDDTTKTSPVALALEIDASAYPYSRLITYSESPYLCVAVSASEVKADSPRKAFYENRFTGQAKAKPAYRSLASAAARDKLRTELHANGLPHGWRGAGYPTYHGGGRRQYQHIRTSRYTMMSDWLFDLKSISNGVKNMPKLTDARVSEAFAAAGRAYDSIVTETQINRFSIIQGYISPLNPSIRDWHDWHRGDVVFQIALPDSTYYDDIMWGALIGRDNGITDIRQARENVAEIYVDVP